MAVTSTVDKGQHGWQVRYSWTSDGSGDATGGTGWKFTGKVVEVVTVPGAGGVQPSAAYDIVLDDDDGLDVLVANGGDLSNSAVEEYVPTAYLSGSDLTLTVSNAGASKEGTVVVYIADHW